MLPDHNNFRNVDFPLFQCGLNRTSVRIFVSAVTIQLYYN